MLYKMFFLSFLFFSFSLKSVWGFGAKEVEETEEELFNLCHQAIKCSDIFIFKEAAWLGSVENVVKKKSFSEERLAKNLGSLDASIEAFICPEQKQSSGKKQPLEQRKLGGMPEFIKKYPETWHERLEGPCGSGFFKRFAQNVAMMATLSEAKKEFNKNNNLG